jgi:acyl-CoA synthetase (AMP-forming)/AMP-acid ligase II
MDTLRGLLARERRSDDLALHAPGDPERTYDFRRLLTNAWKTANFLSHCGVRRGRTVGIVGRSPESILTFLGATSLGAIARFDPPTATDARAVVAPADAVDAFDLAPGGARVAYGESPDDPKIHHFERDVWSENPVLVPTEVAPDDPALAAGEASLTHTELLDTAEGVIERTGMSTDETVTVRAPLALPGTIAAGIVAPLLAGATISFPNGETVGDIAVAVDDASEEIVVGPAAVV